MQLPHGNWFAPAGSSRSGGGGNETVEAFDAKDRCGGPASRAADICLVPTIAQDGLSITSVEAMASGVPVIASRIGGVPFTVSDGHNGLLFEPGDPADLARQIARLLDDPELRRRMGLAGRKRFEEDFTWENVIDRHWRPLLTRRAVVC